MPSFVDKFFNVNPALPVSMQEDRILQQRRFKQQRDLHRLDIRGSAAVHKGNSQALDPEIKNVLLSGKSWETVESQTRQLGRNYQWDFQGQAGLGPADIYRGGPRPDPNMKPIYERFLAIKKAYPTMTPQLSYGLAKQGFDFNDPITLKLAQVNEGYQAKQKKAYEDDDSFVGKLRRQRDRALGMAEGAPGVVVDKASDALRATGGAVPQPIRTGVKKGSQFISLGYDTLTQGVDVAAQVIDKGAQTAVPTLATGINNLLSNDDITTLPAGSTAQDMKANGPGTYRVKGQDELTVEDVKKLPEQFSAGQVLMGKDPGEGFYIGGQAQADREAAAREALTVRGQAPTAGRIIADAFIPENIPAGDVLYNSLSGYIDLRKALWAQRKDPSNKLFDKAEQAIKAPQKFVSSKAEARALLNTLDPDEIGDIVEASFTKLDNGAGGQFIDDLHGLVTKSPAEAYVKSGRKLDPGLLVDLAQNARTIDDTKGMVLQHLGAHSGFVGRGLDHIPNYYSKLIRSKLPFPGFMSTPKQVLQKSRLFLNKPGEYVNLSTDFESNLDNFFNELKTLKVPEDEMYAHLNKFMLAKPELRETVIMDSRKAFKEHYKSSWRDSLYKDKEFVDKVGEDWINENLDDLDQILDQALFPAKERRSRAYMAGDQRQRLTQEHELNLDSLPSIDYHHAKTITNKIIEPFATKTGRSRALKDAISTGNFFGSIYDVQKSIFRNNVLMRGALGVRIIAEGQLRIAAKGLTSAVNRPGEWVAMLSHDPDSLLYKASARMLGHEPGTGVFAKDIKGRAFTRKPGDDAEIAKIMEPYIGSMRMGNTDSFSTMKAYQGPVEYEQRFGAPGAHISNHDDIKDLAHHIAMTRTDTIPAMALREGKDATIKYLQEDEAGQALWAKLQRADSKLQTMPLEQYVDESTKMARQLAGNDPDILRYIATGQGADGVHLPDNELAKLVKSKMTRRVESQYGNKDLVWSDIVPQKWVGVKDAGHDANAAFEVFKKLPTGIMNLFYKRPDDWMTIAPAARQEYWKYVVDHASEMSPKAYKQLLKDAKADGNLPERLLKELDDQADLVKLNKAANMTADEMHELAGRHMNFAVNDLLWTHPKGTQFGDVTRGVFPFPDAFFEVVGAWKKILAANPLTVPLHAQQGVNMINSELTYDPRTGKHTFVLPGTKFLGSLVGRPSGLRATAENLNIIGSSPLPSTFPIGSALIYDITEPYKAWDDIRRTLIFSREKKSVGDVIQETVISVPWMKDLLAALPGSVTENNAGQLKGPEFLAETYAQVNTAIISELYSSGKYGTTEEEYRRLKKDAYDATRNLLGMKSIVDFESPTVSQVPDEVWVKEKDGGRKLAMRVQLANTFHEKFVKKYGDKATEKFIEEFGAGAVVALFSSSESTMIGNVDAEGKDYRRIDIYPSQKLYDFDRKHPELSSKYPGFWNLFAGIGSEWASEEQDRLTNRGEVQSISPQFRVQQANRTLGNIAYRHWLDKTQDQVDDAIDAGIPKSLVNQAFSEARRLKRKELAETFYGFSETSNAGFRSRNEYFVKKVKNAILTKKDPVLLKTDAGRGAVEFFKVVDSADKAWAAARKKGLVEAKSWRTGQTDTAFAFQKAIAEESGNIIGKHPDFWPMYNEIFQFYISSEVDTSQDKPSGD